MPAGALHHLADRVARAGVDEVGRAERLRGLALDLHRVDREDPARAGDACSLDDRLADAAASDDRDRRSRHDPRGVERRSDTGGHAAPDERELRIGQVGVDLHQVRLVAGHLVGEGAEPGHGVRDAAVGAGRLGQHHHLAAHRAEVALAVQAPEAVAAGGDEGRDDMVADRDARDLGSDPLDGARALVAEDARRGRGQRAVGGGHVGVADAARADADDHVGRAGIEGRDVLDRQVDGSREDGSAHVVSLDRAERCGRYRPCAWRAAR